MTRLLACAALACTLSLPAAAQTTPTSYGSPATETNLGSERIKQNAAGSYFYFLPGEQTIRVSVEGGVQYPGLYEVSVSTDLRRILSLAGGPRVDTRDRDEQQRVEVRLFRGGEGQLYAATYQDLASNPVYPPLHQGDTVLVEVIKSRRFGWQQAATIAGGVTAVALLVRALVGGN